MTRWWARREVACPQCATTAPPDAGWCGACGARLRPEPAGEADADDPAPQAGPVGRVVAAVTVLSALGALLAVQVAQEPVPEPAGYTSRGDAARTGVVATVPVPRPSGVAWRAAVDLPPLVSPGADVLGVTVTGDGRELVTVLDPAVAGQRVTSHDAATGEVVATTMLPLGTQPYDTSLAAGLLAHRDLTTVSLVDLATGERRWRVERRLREDTQVTAHGVVGVDAGQQALTVVLLALEDGSEVWRSELASRGRVHEVLPTTSMVVVHGEDGRGPFLRGLDPATGAEWWQLRNDELRAGERPRPVVDGDLVVVAGGRRSLLIDARDGTSTRLPVPERFAPVSAAIGAGRIALTDGATRVVGVDARGWPDVPGVEPAVRWDTPATTAPVFSLAVDGDVVAVRGDSGTVLLDASLGETVAQVAPGGGTARLSLTGGGAVPRQLADGILELVGRDGVVWQRPSVAVHLPDLATADGAVAVTTPVGVQVHDTGDGDRRFAHEAFAPDLVTAGGLTAPSLVAGRVAVAPPLDQPPHRGGLLALFTDTGIIDWARDTDRLAPRGTPVADRDLLLLPVGSQLLGFDRRTGARTLVVETAITRTDLAARGDWLAAVDAPRDSGDLWVGRRSDRRQVFRAPIRTCAPPLLHGDVVVVTDHLGDIVARDLATGEQPWGEKALGSACRPLAMADDVLVALVDDRELLGVSTDDGEPVWRVALPDVAAGAPVVAGGQVLVPTLAGEVLAWDVGADEPTWRVDVGGTPAGAVAVDGDTVLVQTREGELVALR